MDANEIHAPQRPNSVFPLVLNARAAQGRASERVADEVIVRLLAAICVALALIAFALAVLYGRQSERLRCAEDRAEIGLVGRSSVCP